MPEIFPERDEVPKTLIFARTDAHADDIVQVVREEFGKGNDFAVKITSKAGMPPSCCRTSAIPTTLGWPSPWT